MRCYEEINFILFRHLENFCEQACQKEKCAL